MRDSCAKADANSSEGLLGRGWSGKPAPNGYVLMETGQGLGGGQ